MDRRDFLKAGLGGFTSYFLTAGLSLSIPNRAEAAIVEYNISAEESLKPVQGLTEILTWQYVDALAPTLGNLQSHITVFEGDTVIVNLTNNLPTHSIDFNVPGLFSSTLAVAPGQTQTYEFIATQAGSYGFYDTANAGLGRAMGLAGPLVVLPLDNANALYTAALPEHQFDRQYVLMFQEMDSRINNAIAAGLPVDMNSFQPDFFFVNGLMYPDTVYSAPDVIDDNKVILMAANENVALRFINGGLIYYPMHFHGYHTNVVLRNRSLEQFVVEKDTVLVKVDECVDTILPVGSQLGLYPLHTHYVPGVTTNGSYAGGGLLMMKAV